LVIMILSIMILSGMIRDGHSGFHSDMDIRIMVMDIPTAGLIIPMDHHTVTGETPIITDMVIMIMATVMVIIMEAITGLCITDLAVQLKITGWPVHPHIMAGGISAARVQE